MHNYVHLRATFNEQCSPAPPCFDGVISQVRDEFIFSFCITPSVSTRDARLLERVRAWRYNAGAIPGPFEAWLVLRGLKTLPLRIARHGENARELEYMCDIGISARDSLFFSTASAADLMRLADQGRIKEGNSADLVVCDGDALADIKRAARKENHRMVVKRGIVARDNRAAFVRQPTRVAAE